ncbi:DUF4097 family beta strand repeat-containing protein [Cytobacillus gottheilii]|uniref:DUF4097 domain-containing protein n=1 Tax=Cytobacillus gottheilii TaxID=859144 RepID=A0ABX8FCG7_9BACI|nr:DUF4097 domain-containing protein [Cytobacillus gottheilii]QVY61151.1 DUF4097 domain-containing protein [Cytobacillus gottheilii]
MQEERKRILKMVEDGKLKVDEALILLEELEKSSKTAQEKEQNMFPELSNKVHFEEAKKEDPLNEKFNSAKVKIIDFVDSALKKIKDADFDLNFGQSVDITHIFQYSNVYLKNIDIDVANGGIKLIPWEQQDVRIECNAKVYRVETQEEARQKFLKDVLFAVEGEKLRFSAQQKWMKLEASIYVPQSQYENIKVRMFNGPIDGENLYAESFKAKSANGKINVAGLQGKYAEVETANGQINISNSTVDEFEIETINGVVHVEGSCKKADIQTFHGDIHCTIKGTGCEQLEAKVTTGNIELFVPEFTAVNGELKTNLGSFNVELDGIEVIEEKSEVIQKNLRFRSLKDPVSGLRLLADSKTGSISVKKSAII